MRSMTGYGRAEYVGDDLALRVEIRSVNNRGLRLSSNLPDFLSGLSSEIERVVRDAVMRGAVTVRVDYEDLRHDIPVTLDHALARKYHDEIVALSKELGIGENVEISTILSMPGVVSGKQKQTDVVDDEKRRIVLEVVRQAVSELVQMRKAEGEALKNELLRLLARVEEFLDGVEKRARETLPQHHAALVERVSKLLEGFETSITLPDLVRELALYADRIDITEEVCRFRSHLSQFRDAVEANEPVGRKLEFITQELLREANTIGSKANNPEVSRAVVEMKNEIEKIREQVFNIE